MGYLRTAETRWGPQLRRTHRLPADTDLAATVGVPACDWAAHHHHPDHRVDAGRPLATAAAPVVGFVNHGRWLAACPFCGNAQEISLDDPRFLCAGCLNTAAGGGYLPLLLPDRRTLARIERLLGVRVQLHSRNWAPGETTGQLAAENRAHEQVEVVLPDGTRKLMPGLLPAPVLA